MFAQNKTNDQAMMVKAAVEQPPIERVMEQLDDDIGRLSNAIERLHNKLGGVLKRDDRDSLATATDPVHENASGLFRALDEKAYAIRAAAVRVEYIIDQLEL